MAEQVRQIFHLFASNNLEVIRQHLPVPVLRTKAVLLLTPVHLLPNWENDLKELTWDEAGGTILHLKGLSLIGSYPIVKFLLRNIKPQLSQTSLEAFINTSNINGESPLHIAAKSSNIELLKLYLEHGADPYIQNSQDFTALHSVIAGSTSSSQGLPKVPNETYSEPNAILCIFELIEAERRFKSSKNWRSLLGIENCNHQTALMMAEANNEVNLIKALRACLKKSIVQNHLFELVMSVRRKAFPEEGKEKSIKDLGTDAGPTIMDEQDSNGMTILHLAAEGALPNTLEYIFKYLSVNLGCTDKKGRTALHYAALNGHSESGQRCIDILLENDRYMLTSIKNLTDGEGLTALDIVLDRKAVKAAEIMLKNGCDIYSKDILQRIYKTMPQIIVTYLDNYGAFVSCDENGSSKGDTSHKDKGKGCELYYSFSAIVGQDVLNSQAVICYQEEPQIIEPQVDLATATCIPQVKVMGKILDLEYEIIEPQPQVKYNCIITPSTNQPLKEESRFLVHTLNCRVETKSQILGHPLVKLFLDQKWKKFRWWYYGYLLFYFLFLISYSWYTVYVFAVECPYTKVMEAMASPSNGSSSAAGSNAKIVPTVPWSPQPPPNFGFGSYGDRDRTAWFPPTPPTVFGVTSKRPNISNSVYSWFPTMPKATTTVPWKLPSPPIVIDRRIKGQEQSAKGPEPPSVDSLGSFRPSRLVGVILIAPAVIILLNLWIRIQQNEFFHERFINACQVVAMFVIMFNCGQSCTAYTGMQAWRYILAWIGIFCAWMTSMDELGKIPWTGKYVSVWKCVTVRSFWFMLPFVPLMAAFTFAFKVMMPQNQRFETISSSVVTLMAFLIGELEYQDLFYKEMEFLSPFPTVAVQIFFAIFIFVIPLVLLNLLIGLAVNEISKVIRNGSIDFRCQQLKDIYLTEKILACFSNKIYKSQWAQKYFIGWPRADSVQREGITDDFYSCGKLPEYIQYEIRNRCTNLYLKATDCSREPLKKWSMGTVGRLLWKNHERQRWWIQTNTTNRIPEGCLVAGIEHGNLVHIIRARYAGGIIPGKHTEFPTHSFAWISYGGIEAKVSDFEILKVSPEFVTWEKISSGHLIPDTAIIGGITCDGPDLLIGRTAHEGNVIVGKVDKRRNVLCITFNGQEFMNTEFEVLCYRFSNAH